VSRDAAGAETGQTDPDSGEFDADIDAGPVDAGPPPDDACATAEICNNGLDDNCDGKIDCEDPQCNAGWSCTPVAIPAGWSVVEYVANARPSCAPSYATSVDVVEGPEGSPASCGCTCPVTTPGTCENGSVAVAVGSGLGCSPLGSATNAANNGACSVLPSTLDYAPGPGAKMQVTGPGYTAGQCTGVPTQSESDAGAANQGRICRDIQSTGAGCSNGAACAPVAQGDGFAVCILHSGVQTCPAGFPTLHAVGGGLADGRGCTACTCGTATATCQNAQMTFFTDGGCDDASSATVAADGKCNDFPGPNGLGGPTYIAYEYAAQVASEGCAPSPVSPDGGVTLTQPRTVCCQ